MKPHPAKPVEVQLRGSNFLELVPAADISASGAGICIEHDVAGYDFDQEIEIVVTLPNERPFVATGRVRSKSTRSGVHVLGVEFIELSKDGRCQLLTYVQRMLILGRSC